MESRIVLRHLGERLEEVLSPLVVGGIEAGAITFELNQAIVDQFVTVSEAEIAAAMRMFISKDGRAIEGAAGVALAAMIAGKDRLAGQNVVVIICGRHHEEDNHSHHHASDNERPPPIPRSRRFTTAFLPDRSINAPSCPRSRGHPLAAQHVPMAAFRDRLSAARCSSAAGHRELPKIGPPSV